MKKYAIMKIIEKHMKRLMRKVNKHNEKYGWDLAYPDLEKAFEDLKQDFGWMKEDESFSGNRTEGAVCLWIDSGVGWEMLSYDGNLYEKIGYEIIQEIQEKLKYECEFYDRCHLDIFDNN